MKMRTFNVANPNVEFPIQDSNRLLAQTAAANGTYETAIFTAHAPVQIQAVKITPDTVVTGGSATTTAVLNITRYTPVTVGRVQAGGAGNVSEIQLISPPLGGGAATFTATFLGVASASIACNATPATAQTAIQGISTVGASNALVTQTTAPTLVTFASGQASLPQNLLQGDPTNLTPAKATITVVPQPDGKGGIIAGLPAVLAVQTLTITGTPTAGTLTFQYQGLTNTGPAQTTGTAAWNATPSTVATNIATAINALTNLSGNTVAVVATSANLFTITWQTAGPVATLGVNAGSYTGATGASIVTTTPGQTAVSAIQQVNITGATGGTFTLSYITSTGAIQTTAAITYSATPATLQTNITAGLVALAGIGAGGVTSAQGVAPYTVTFAAALANEPLALMGASVTKFPNTDGNVANIGLWGLNLPPLTPYDLGPYSGIAKTLTKGDVLTVKYVQSATTGLALPAAKVEVNYSVAGTSRV